MDNLLIGVKKTPDYWLYRSPMVERSYREMSIAAGASYQNVSDLFKTYGVDPDTDVLGDKALLRLYNIFSYTSGNPHFYILYKQIAAAVREYTNNPDRPMWIQAWINYHKPNEVLPWHAHDGTLLHGYISIDPKNTVTQFLNYTIENKIGLLYLGRPGPEYRHQVVVREPYEGYRVTLAFDIIDDTDISSTTYLNPSFIPLP